MNVLKSIRVQLILFFLIISLISSAIVSVTNYLETEKLLNRSFDRELEKTTALIQLNIEGNLADIEKAVSAFVSHPDVRKLDSVKIQEISALFLEYVNIFYNLYVYSSDGDLVSVLYYERENIRERKGHKKNLSMLKNEFYHVAMRVLEEGTPRYTKTFPRKDKLLIAYVAPIFDPSGKMVKGLASCGIFVDNPKVKKLLRNLVPAYSGFVCLLDSSGNVFGKEGNIPEHINSFSIQTLLEQSGKSQSILQLGEQTYRYRLKEIKNANFYVLVAVSDSVLKGMLMALAEEVITLNLLSFLLALLVSIILANLLVQPINKLVEGLREVGKGNYAYAIKARSFGEMEEAINSFNDMTEKLQKNRMIEKLWDEQWKSGDSSE